MPQSQKASTATEQVQVQISTSSLQSGLESRSNSSEDNGSQGSEEIPWDVKRSYSEDENSQKSQASKNSKTKPTMKKKQQHNQHHPSNEIGELPALNLSKSEDEPVAMKSATGQQKIMLSGQRTLRPIAPPSRKGGVEQQRQREKQKKKQRRAGQRADRRNDDFDEEADEDFDNDDDPEAFDNDEDMPMDERNDQRKRRQEAALLCSDDTGMMGADICDFTLSSLGQICGLSPGGDDEGRSPSSSRSRSRSSPGKKSKSKLYADPAKPNVPTLPVMKAPYGAEEQTAIEVEYVEPERREPEAKSDVSVGTSTSADGRKKNLLVQAMAKRAKESYEKTKGGKGDSPEQSLKTTDPPDNVYSSFNPSEKRKFLKSINSGMTPSDATQQVLMERAEGDAAMEQVGEGSSSKNSKSRLAFWKRSREDDDEKIPKEVGKSAAVSPNKAKKDSDAASASTAEADKEQFAKSGINYYDAVRKDRPLDEESINNTPGIPEVQADDEVANRAAGKKKKNRLSKFGKLGFARLGSTNNYDAPIPDKTAVAASTTTKSPEKTQSTAASTPRSAESSAAPSTPNMPMNSASPSTPKSSEPSSSAESTRRSVHEARSMLPPPAPPPREPASPPRPFNTAVSFESDDSLSRNIFKPIPVKAEPTAASIALSPPRMQSGSFSDDDSLLQDDSFEDFLPPPKKQEVEEEFVIPPVAAAAAGVGLATVAAASLPEEKKDDTHSKDDNSIEEQMTAMLLTGASPARSMGTSHPDPSTPGSRDLSIESSASEQEANMEMDGMDLDVDTYMNNEIGNVYGGNNSVADHVSVVSGKSYKTTGTAYTQGTNYTTSSRIRRPGVAKQRLAAQKEAEQKTTQKHAGWQESIQAAAAQTGRVWDPQRGWVDYVDPNASMEDGGVEHRLEDQRLQGKIHVPIERIKRAPGAVEDDGMAEDGGQAVQVPFPQAWKKERNEMLNVDGTISAAQEQAPSPSRKKSGTARSQTSPARSASSRPPISSPPKSRGWVETMKQATANLPNKDGKKWDPERGWVGLDDQETVAPPGFDRYSGSITDQSPTDTADLMSAAPPSQQAQNTAQAAGQQEPSGLLPQHVTDKQEPSGLIPVHGHGDEHLTDDVITLGGTSAKSGKSDRYMQIGDSGSVKSFYRNGKIQAKASPEVSRSAPPPARTPDMFGKLDEARKEHDSGQRVGEQRNSVLVNVVRQRIDSNDASLFPEEVKKGGRRGAGPVDLDEIDDEMENGSFDAPPDFSWDEGQSNVSSMLASPPEKLLEQGSDSGRKAVPTLKINVRDPSKAGTRQQLSNKSAESRPLGERSFDTVSTTSKSIPRLRGPKRDTSPIRGRRSAGSNKGNKPSPSAEAELVSNERQMGPDPVPAAQQGLILSESGLPPPRQMRSVQSRAIHQESSPGTGISPPGQMRSVQSRAIHQESPPGTGVSPPGQMRSVQSRAIHQESPPGTGVSPPGQMRSVQSRAIHQESPPGTGVSPPGQMRSVQSRAIHQESPHGRSQPMPERPMQRITPPVKMSPAGDDRTSYTEDSSPSSNSVKEKAQLFEQKTVSPESIGESEEFQDMPQVAEWKSFLAKKVQAESAAATRNNAPGHRDEQDSLFDLPESEGAFPSARRNNNPTATLPGTDRHDLMTLEEISDLSPIRVEDDDDDDDDDDSRGPSETGTDALQGNTFLERLQACAAPIIPRNNNGDASCSPAMPMAHLAFLRQNPNAQGGTPEKQNSSVSRFLPAALCGRPDVIVEETDDDESEVESETRQNREERLRSHSNPRSSRQSGDVSSVISDEQFGAKTAYLEALAMKAAVKGSKKSKRRSTESVSDTSGSSSKHSEKWQRFLDKKGANDAGSPQEQRNTEDVSRAAEKYAAEKVDEMMEIMAQRSKSSPGEREFQARPMEEATGAFPSLDNAYGMNKTRSSANYHPDNTYRKNESARAAEDLAAARVEAMMQTLSSQNLDEGEI